MSRFSSSALLLLLSSGSVTIAAFSFGPKTSNVAKVGPLFSSSSKSSTGIPKFQHDNDDWIREEFSKPKKGADDVTSAAQVQGRRAVVGPKEVLVYDTSLRDGTQGESVSASCDDKLKITRRLASFGVDFIEAGWPGSNPKDAEFFRRAKTELTDDEKAKLSAFGSTRRKSIAVDQDAQIQALIDSEAPTVCIVAKAHSWQVTDILRATLDENLEMIYDSVEYLSKGGQQVYVDLEHFFDGYKYDKDYTLQCCQAAIDAGVDGLVLCDTNGGSMPWEIEEATKTVVDHFASTADVTFGIHAHNDCGMAVANSIMAAKSGAGMVQGTINGIGERTGNADLCSIVPSLALHVETEKMTCAPQLEEITSLSRFVDELLNRTPNHAAPYVGSSAFAHKGGLHVAAMERSPMSYQHVDPTQVGNEKRVLISELSGRQNIMGKIKEAGFGDGSDTENDKTVSERATAILTRVKQLENIGYTFEGADASVHLMILHSTRGYCPPFRVLDYSVQVYDYNIDSASRVILFGQDMGNDEDRPKNQRNGNPSARATIQLRTPNYDDVPNEKGEVPPLYSDQLEVADGDGPVDALASALKRALIPSHPSLTNLELVDYKVRILDPESATAAATRVMVEFRNTENDETWTTVSVDRNIISASLNALVDGFEYALVEYAQSCMLCEDDYAY